MRNSQDKKKNERLDSSEFKSYIRQCRKKAFKKIHSTQMKIFYDDVRVPIKHIQSVLKKKNTSVSVDSILNSRFSKKPVQEVKKTNKIKRTGTLDVSKCDKLTEDVIEQVLFSQSAKRSSIFKESNQNLERKDNNPINDMYEKNKQLKERRNLSLLQLRNEKVLKESLEIQEKPYVSNKSKMMIANRSTKPIFMRVWEDEEIKERNLSILKNNIEEEKNYFSEIRINPLNKRQNISNNNSIDKSQRFDNWFDSNTQWNRKRQIQRQILYELKQNEEEKSYKALKPNNSNIESNKMLNESFFERMNKKNNEKKSHIKKIRSDISPTFKIKTNNKLPNYLNKYVNTSFTTNMIELKSTIKTDLLNKNIKNYYSNNSKKSCSTNITKSVRKNYSSNNLNRSIDEREEQKKYGNWEKIIHNVNDISKKDRLSNDQKLYKINVRNSSSCDIEKGSIVLMDNKISKILSCLARKKIVNMDDLCVNKDLIKCRNNVKLSSFIKKKDSSTINSTINNSMIKQ